MGEDRTGPPGKPRGSPLTTAAGDEEEHLRRLCLALDDHQVDYIIFGSFAGRLQGAPLPTVDVDVVPEMSEANLERLCDALNSLDPRWRIDDVSAGIRIDGRRLEPRHIRGSSVAIGLVTSAGLVDLLIEPRGFEAGFDDLIRNDDRDFGLGH